ncbi:hypothetical protein [Butyrivibrio fibrisolvens]|uniref:hypothetical protein n=1 Tax=Butyrivibrio fibrisolvens TaxID=831 RepID=UPI0003B4AE82|nr:hypothetical protein [Butyrivibrio fibrisolvens]
MFYRKNPNNPEENIIVKRCVKIDPDAKIPNLGYAYIYGYADGEKSIDMNKISKIIVNSDELKRRKDYWEDLKDRMEEATAMLKPYGYKAPEDHPELKEYEETMNEYLQFSKQNACTIKSRDGQAPYNNTFYKDLQKNWYIFDDEVAMNINMKYNGYTTTKPTDYECIIYGIDYVREQAGVPAENMIRWHQEEQRREEEQKERERAEAEKRKKEQARIARIEKNRLINEYNNLLQMEEEQQEPEKEMSFWEKVFDRSHDDDEVIDERGHIRTVGEMKEREWQEYEDDLYLF